MNAYDACRAAEERSLRMEADLLLSFPEHSLTRERLERIDALAHEIRDFQQRVFPVLNDATAAEWLAGTRRDADLCRVWVRLRERHSGGLLGLYHREYAEAGGAYADFQQWSEAA